MGRSVASVGSQLVLDRSGRDVRLEAPAVAAVAHPPCGVDGYMPELAGIAGRPAEGLVGEDEASADTRCEVDEGHAARAPGPADPALTHGRGRRVVVEDHRQVEPVRDGVP